MREKKTKQARNTKNLKSFYIKKKKKEIKDTIIRDTWTLFETEGEKEERKKLEKKEHNERLIKYRLIRDMTTRFEQEEESYYWPERVINFWNNNYIEYERNSDKNKNSLLNGYLNKTEP